MPSSASSVHVGEIQAGSGGGLLNGRTFVLTAPFAKDRGRTELLFGLCAAETPKRVVDKLCDRLAEELREGFFAPRGTAAPEERFENAIKQANKTVLSFLYEHGLSLPGIKLRATLGALSGDQLFVSARGDVRGFLALPRQRTLQAFDLFAESPLKPGEPKFFTSLQAGALPSGGRFIAATSETFEALDPAYVRALCCQPDMQRSVRDLKNALRGARTPITILTLETPSAEPLENTATIPAAQPSRAAAQPKATLQPVGADVGDLVARGVRAGALSTWNAIGWTGSLLTQAGQSVWKMPGALMHRERRSEALSSVRRAPDEAVGKAIAAFNRLPEHGRRPLLLLVACGAILAHGLLFAHQRQASAKLLRAHDVALMELERLERDFDSAMLVQDDRRGSDILTQMRALTETLPPERKASATESIEARSGQLRRDTDIATPAIFAEVDSEGGLFTLSTLARFDGKLYLFSRTAPVVRVYAADGSMERRDLEGIPAGIDAAAPARTGFLLRTSAGRIYYWNPSGGPASEYANADGTAGPLLFYEGRLYAADAEGRINRRTIGSQSLGAPAAVVAEPAWKSAPTGIAVDGAVYALRNDGAIAKYAKGQLVTDFGPGTIDPPLADASDLWTSADASFLALAEHGGAGRLLLLDKANGRLLAQLRSPAFAGLGSSAIAEDGATAWLYAGGKIYAVPLKEHLPK